MEMVTDMELYHVRKYSYGDKFIEGEVINTSTTEYNKFFGVYDTSDVPELNNSQTIFEALTYYWHYTRETIFDENRIQVNSELPSRKKSMWLCDVRSLDYWMKEKGYTNDTHQVLKMKLDGKLFKCDATFVEGKPKKLNDVREDANRYWNQEITNEKRIEYLFEGRATVSEIINFTHESI